MSNKKFLNQQAKKLVKNYLKFYLVKYGFDLKNNVSHVIRFDKQNIYKIKDESEEEKVVCTVYFNHIKNIFGMNIKLNSIEKNYICRLMKKFKEIVEYDEVLAFTSLKDELIFKLFDYDYFENQINKIELEKHKTLNEIELRKNFLNYVSLEFKKENYKELNYSDFYEYIVLNYIE